LFPVAFSNIGISVPKNIGQRTAAGDNVISAACAGAPATMRSSSLQCHNDKFRPDFHDELPPNGVQKLPRRAAFATRGWRSSRRPKTATMRNRAEWPSISN